MKYISLNEVGLNDSGEGLYGTVNVFEFFEKSEFQVLCREALNKNEILAPSLNHPNQRTAKCVKSCHFYPYNFLFFKGDEIDYWIIQHLVFCDSIFIPSIDTVVCGNSSPTKARVTFDKYLPLLTSEGEGGFNGIINGYHRPYHFFYDKLCSVVNLLEDNFGCHYVNTHGAFIDLRSLSKDFVSDPELKPEGFYLLPSKMVYKKTPRSFFEKVKFLVSKDDERTLATRDSDCIIWFGISLEKREFLERSNVICEIIKNIKGRYRNPVFIFDGLTRGYGQKREDFLSSHCDKEVAIYEEITAKFSGVRFVNLIGATAEEKINYGSLVDFYFSSYLTDSIWCSAFGAAPGIAYRPRAAYGRGSFVHPLTHEVPNEKVFDVGVTSTGDYDGQNISIDTNWLVNYVISSIEVTLPVNKWLCEIQKAINSGKNGFTSPSWKISVRKNSFLNVKVDDFYRNIEVMILRVRGGDNSVIIMEDLIAVKKFFLSEGDFCFDLIVVTKEGREWRPRVSFSFSDT